MLSHKCLASCTHTLKINGSLNVKASNIANANGTGSFIDSNKLKTSDLNFLVSCKVVNQTVMEDNLNVFMPLPNLKAESFTNIYGDCFISGQLACFAIKESCSRIQAFKLVVNSMH